MLQACSNGHVNMRQVGHGIVRLHGLQTHRLLPCIKPLSAARHSMRAAATHSSSEPPVESQDVPDEQQLANQQAAPQGDQQPAGKVSAFTRRSTMLGACASLHAAVWHSIDLAMMQPGLAVQFNHSTREWAHG